MNYQKLYRKDRLNKKFLIADKMEIATNVKIYKVGKKDFQSMVNDETQKFKKSKKSSSYRTCKVWQGVDYRINVSYNFKNKFIQVSIYRDLNGNRIMRELYLQGKKPPYPSADGKDNFITHEESVEILKKYKITRYDFTKNKLPEIIWDEFLMIFTEVFYNFINPIAKKHFPRAEIPKSWNKKNSFSFQFIEVANDIPINKYFSLYKEDGSRKEFDPTKDDAILRNLNQESNSTQSFDWKNGTRVVSSSETYEKGVREVKYELHDMTEGHFYLKDIRGIEKDIIRLENQYEGRNVGNNTKDTIYKIAKKKVVGSPDDIRKIFKKLCQHTHVITGNIFDVPERLLTDKEKNERLWKILTTHFEYSDELEYLVEVLSQNHFKISVKAFSPGMQSEIRSLSLHGFIFKQLGGKRSGLYAFKKELLGN